MAVHEGVGIGSGREPYIAALARPLQLDHVGAEVGEVLAAERAGDDPAHVQHLQPVQPPGMASPPFVATCCEVIRLSRK
jgi:hypothetical protein